MFLHIYIGNTYLHMHFFPKIYCIGQLRIWWKQTKAFFDILADVNNLNSEFRMLCHLKKKMQTKVANTCVIRSVELHWMYNNCMIWLLILLICCELYVLLDLCESATMICYSNHSINQDSAHWPMGIKMHRPISSYFVRKLNRDVMQN